MSVEQGGLAFLDTMKLKARWQFSFYDALVVAAALQAGCTRLLSEDMQHGRQIGSLRIQNPFIQSWRRVPWTDSVWRRRLGAKMRAVSPHGATPWHSPNEPG